MSSQQTIINSNNSFMQQLAANQKRFNEKMKMQSAVNSLGKDGKTAPKGHCSALYAMLLSMGNMMDMNLAAAAQGADHLNACNTQLNLNNSDIDNLNQQLKDLKHLSGNKMLTKMSEYNTTVLVDNTKLNNIQTDEQMTTSSVKNSASYNEVEHTLAEAMLALYAQFEHTANNRIPR